MFGFDNLAQFSPRRKLMEAARQFGSNPRIKQLLQEADRRFCFNAADPYLSSVDRNSNEWIIWSHYQSLLDEFSAVTLENTKNGPEQTIPLSSFASIISNQNLIPLDGQLSIWKMEPNLPNDVFSTLNIKQSSIVDKQPPSLLADQNSSFPFDPSLSLAPNISPDYGQGSKNGSSRTTYVLERWKRFDDSVICKRPDPYNTPLSSCDESQARAFLRRNAKSTTSKYMCREDECLFIFTSSKEEKRHFKSEHSNKAYKCYLCKKTYTRKDSMKRHYMETCKLRLQPKK